MFPQLFCRHKWETHSKEEFAGKQTRIVPGTEHFFKPRFETIEVSEFTEILVCIKCGKINKIEY